MTAREEVIAAAKEAGFYVEEDGSIWDHNDYVEQGGCGMENIEDKLQLFADKFFESGAESVRKALMDGDTYGYWVRVGAASRDAEIKGIEASLDLAKHERNNLNETVGKLDAEVAGLRAELAAAIAACKAKDEALDQLLDDMGDDGHCVCPAAKQLAIEALAIQPDESALKAWLGEPVAMTTENGLLFNATCAALEPLMQLYSPKELK